MQFDIAMEEQLPRQAYFKVGKSVNSTVLKKEMIEYSADKSDIVVKRRPEVARFLISGDCMIDGRQSFFSLKLKTNTFTAMLSGDVTSIIKKIVIKLPSNSNQVLEEIENYNTLSSMIQMMELDSGRMNANWQSGMNSLVDHNRPESQQRARRFLNLNEGGTRTFVFQLNLSSILFHEQFLPLSLLNGILLEVHLATAQEAFHYNPQLETWDEVFSNVDGMFLSQADHNALTRPEATAVHDQLTDFYNRPEPSGQDLEYSISSFTLHAAAIWMNFDYVKRLVQKATSDAGINIFYTSYRFNQLPNEGSLIKYANLTEQYQNLKRVLFATLNKQRLQSSTDHSFNIFENAIKTYRFRIGSRSWQTVDNSQPALSYAQTMQSLGMLFKAKGNGTSFSTYPRTQNIHVFDFEKVPDEMYSGEDTTNGRTLTLEMQFNASDDVVLKDAAGTPLVGQNGEPLTMQRGAKPSDSVVYMFQNFTKMINISNKGIAVTD
jgi:hypothetical protein